MVIDLTSIEGVKGLMEGSRTEEEWNRNCNQVKAANGRDYPSFWYREVVLSGLASRVAANWKGDADIHIVGVRR